MIKLASMEILSAEIAGSRHIRRQAAKALGVKSSFINKTAHRATFEYDPRPGYLYVRSRAISSRCNDNYDEFPASEIKEAYNTFVGKPVFVNHVNEDHRRARGVIIDAALHEDHNHDGTPDTWAEVLMEVDANSFPKLAQAILAGHVDRTSMGCDVKYSVCSACGNKASTPSEYCSHIPRQKGSKLVRRSAATGRPEEVLIREICYGLGFFENSLLVEDPADPTAYFLGVDDRGLSMHASSPPEASVRPSGGLGAFVASVAPSGAPGGLGGFVASTKTASITMTPPEVYRKFEYPDYKAKTLPTLARDLKKASPHYYNTLKDDIAQNGVKEPILVRHTMGGRPLKRPKVMSGHHRAAIAHELNLHIPVGDFDNDEDHRASMDIGQSWFRDHSEDKAKEPSPWKRESGLESFVASVNPPPNLGGKGHVFEPEEPGSPWCAECGHHNSVTRHKEAGLAGFVAADEHLTNPADGTKEWHHGTKNDFKHFDEERPEDEDPDNEAEYDPDNNPHWNSHIGTHWTSLHDTAHKFARGIAYGWNHQPKDTGEGHVFTANLGIKNPKRYKSETDMDHEAFNHAWEHHDAHDPDDIHGGHCDNNECYGLEEHDPGDHVDRAAKSHYGEKGQDARWLSGHPDSQSIAEGFKQRLQKKGHDGITYGNAVPEEGPVGHKCAITFDNHQIHNLVRRNRQGHVAGLAAFVADREAPHPRSTKSFMHPDNVSGPALAEHTNKTKDMLPATSGGHSQAVKTKKLINQRISDELISRMGKDKGLHKWAHKRAYDTNEGNDTDFHDWNHVKPTGNATDPNHVTPEDMIHHHVRQAIDAWADDSADHSTDSLALQHGISKHFNMPDKLTDHMRGDERSQRAYQSGVDHYEKHKPFMHHFIDTVYQHTQQDLKDAGVTHMVLHRGSTFETPEHTPQWARPPVKKIGPKDNFGYKPLEFHPQESRSQRFSAQPLSSWSASKHEAEGFACANNHKQDSYGHVMTSVIPRHRIFSIASQSGPGCLSEREATVLGGHGEGHLHFSHSHWDEHEINSAYPHNFKVHKQAMSDIDMDEYPMIDEDPLNANWIKQVRKTHDLDADGNSIVPRVVKDPPKTAGLNAFVASIGKVYT